MSDPNQFPDPILDEELVRDGCFPVEQRIPYTPKNELVKQFHKGSCAAASCRMILRDNGFDESEAFIRGIELQDDLFVDVKNGGYISNVPDVLRILGLTVSYRFEPKLTFEQLRAATACGKAAIVSIILSPQDAHAIVVDGMKEEVVDGVEKEAVLIRDPLGESYKVVKEDFLCLWKGKCVIPA